MLNRTVLHSLGFAREWLVDDSFPDEATLRRSDTPELHLLLADRYLIEGHIPEAEREFVRAEELLNSTTQVDLLRRAYSGRVVVYELRQDWDRAEKMLETWATKLPDDPLVHFRKGRLKSLKGFKTDADGKSFDVYYRSAKNEFVEARRLQQSRGVGKHDLVIERPEVELLNLYTMVNQLDRARVEITSLEETESQCPNDLKEADRILRQLATWYLRRGEFRNAYKFCNKATELDKKSTVIHSLDLLLRYYADDPSAEADLSKMYAANPGDFFASNYFALVLCESKEESKRKQAVRIAELNVRFNPQSAEALSTLGWCYFKTKRPADALRVMREIPKGAEMSPDAIYYLALALYAEKPRDRDEVIRLIRLASDVNKPFKHRREANDLIGRKY